MKFCNLISLLQVLHFSYKTCNLSPFTYNTCDVIKRCRLFDAKQLVLYMLIYLQDACSVSNRATMSAVVQTVRCFTIIAGVSICNLTCFCMLLRLCYSSL